MSKKHNFIRNCWFELPCPQSWDSLKDIGLADTRFCDKCGRAVYLADDEATLSELMRKKRCVALSHELFIVTTKTITRPRAGRYLGHYVRGDEE